MRVSRRNAILSLFSGAGGLDLGFRRAGFRVGLAIDNDEAAAKTYQSNHESAAVHRGDLASMDAGELVRLWRRWSPASEPVGVVGGPPCQAFSAANPRATDEDARRHLPAKYAALLKGLNDELSLDFFAFENVVGLLAPRHRDYYAALLQKFEAAGFTIWPTVLDAQRFGVAQRRRRLFVVGLNSRKFAPRDFAVGRERTHSPSPTVRQAIGHLPEPVLFERGLSPDLIPYHPNHWSMVPRSPKFRNGLLKARGVNGRSFRVLKWDDPSGTISFGHREVYVHPLGHRRLSVLEAMLLQGFPFSYRLVGTLSDQFRLVSDAVPPPVAHALASRIRDLVRHSSSPPSRRGRGT